MTEVTTQPGLLDLFGLDGKLFLAQLVNFAVVIFVVAKWVYKPLLRAVDARQKTIQTGLEDAEVAKRDRELSAAEAKATKTKSQKEGQGIVEAARQEALAERARLTAETQAELERQLEEARLRIQEEKAAMTLSVKKDMVELILAATQKVASQTLDEKAHRALIQSAITDLEKSS